LAVQWLDVIWSILVLNGIEKVRVVPGFTQGSALDLYYMPYTHGLIGALVLSIIFGGVVSLFFKQQKLAVFLATAAAVFSHWILDLVVHMPDLWIWDGIKVGFGLWRWEWISLPLELACLAGGAWVYARFVPAKPRGNVWLWIFVAAMAAAELYGAFGPEPASPVAEAHTALAAYGALALLAGFVDLSRTKK
ncbi:MAG TPA: hypothetical protein VG867_00960, partial [Rhizomicrobium sp.]|nr:hypothetical protein [Rhizomicrobium sp.]